MATYDSFRDIFARTVRKNPSTVLPSTMRIIPAKTHFVEWFCGDNLDDKRWVTGTSGTSVFAMSDSIDGGFSLKTGGVNGNKSWIDFGGNDVRQFANNGSACIVVSKLVSTNYGYMEVGMNGNDYMEVKSAIRWYSDSYNNNIKFKVDSHTAIDSGLSAGEENNWHCYKIETKTSSSEGKIDGVLKTTSDIPNAYGTNLQPFVYVANSEGGGVIEGLVRYFEAWNT